jgi:type I restriction enzyme S subunit
VGLPRYPLDAQRAIADYLDRETARMDALINAKRHMANLLALRLKIEIGKRLLATNHAALPLKRMWRITDCKHVTPNYVARGFPVISPGDATPGRLDVSRAHRFVSDIDFERLTAGDRRPAPGDIIYSRNASIGIASYVDTDEPFCMGQDVVLIRAADSADQLFLTYFLNSLALVQLEEMKLGSTFSRVNIAQIAELVVPTPPVDEQVRVARELDEVSARHGRLTKTLERQVALLRDRRQALITAAVTGDLPVPVTV